VQKVRARLAYEVVADTDGAACLACAHAPGGALYPEEASAHVVAALVAAAERAAGCAFTRAVVSVPAYFDAEQCAATETAGARPCHLACCAIACVCKPARGYQPGAKV
jgi:Hsp70 protein